MWKTILDLFFPINCLGCNQEGQFICPACFKQIPLNRKLPLKFSRSSALTGLIIASHYNHPLVKQAIHRYKYGFVKDLAEPLGRLMIKAIKKRIFISPFILIPVPLHKKRLRWRGFNQAELLALEISQHLNIPVVNNILVRTKHNLPQVNIKSSPERKENIKQAFELSPQEEGRVSRFHARVALETPRSCEARSWSKGRLFKGRGREVRPLKINLKNKTIILVDDVCTTGATLEECAKVLKPLQPKQIWGLVVARG